MLDGLDTSRLLISAEAEEQRRRHHAALLLASTAQTKTKSKRNGNAKQAKQDDAATLLGQSILARLQRVTIHQHGSVMSLEACVHHSDSSLALFLVGDDVRWTPAQDAPLLVGTQDQTFQCVYLGTSVTFGLQGHLLGFILLEDDQKCAA